MKIKNSSQNKIIITFLALTIIIITVLAGSYTISTELEYQLQLTLGNVASQNALALHNKVHGNYSLLLSLSSEMKDVTPETVVEKLHSFDCFLDEYNLKRFAFAFPDGSSYGTDGGNGNLSYREFFKRGMQGKGTITEVLVDALEEHHELINVLSIPVYNDENTIVGVFGVAYPSETFNASMDISSFNGEGFSCAINQKGQILVANGNEFLQISQNLISDILEKNTHNLSSIQNITQAIETNTESGGTFTLEEDYFYHILPLTLLEGDETWYILTMMPTRTFQKRLDPILKMLYFMAFIVAICIIVGIGFLLLISKEKRDFELRYAYIDPLTEGANYAKFCLDFNNSKNKKGYIVSLDLANFNSINIASGKSNGDNMLCEVWRLIKNMLQRDEYACHVQEDVFALHLKAKEIDELLSRLNELSSQISLHAKTYQVNGIHARYGIILYDEKETIEEAYSKALFAREQIRSQQNLFYAFYNEIAHEKIQEEHKLEERFSNALLKKEFEVWYQPKYDASSHKINGSEALVRWRDNDGSLISPGKFIPLFEKNGMIVRLDEYMFRTVCEQQMKWLNEGKKVLPVSINLSRASLYNSNIIDRYTNIIQAIGIPTKYIQIEITESAFMDISNVQSILEQFKDLGIRILMDDFGSGYSSLSTLNLPCFDTLKLDKSLVDHIGDKNGDILLFNVISMGKQLGLHITAEGVENNYQLKFLEENQCDDIQGYLFAKPMPKEQFEQLF